MSSIQWRGVFPALTTKFTASDEIDWADVRGIEATGEDGVRVGAMLLEPPGYEPGKAYPTIAYIHGGPVGQDGFEFDWMAQAFAARLMSRRRPAHEKPRHRAGA